MSQLVLPSGGYVGSAIQDTESSLRAAYVGDRIELEEFEQRLEAVLHKPQPVRPKSEVERTGHGWFYSPYLFSMLFIVCAYIHYRVGI